MNKYILQYFTDNGSFDLDEHLIPLIGNDKEELKNDVEIVIDMCNKGQFYKLNYATFCMYWRLL